MPSGMEDRALCSGDLGERFSEMDLVDGGGGGGTSSKENLSQVMKAVEDAENTIRLQLEENNRLREELAQRTEELKKYKLDVAKSYRSSIDDERNENVRARDTHMHQAMNESDGSQWMDNNPALDSLGTMALHQNGLQRNDTMFQNSVGGHHYSGNRGNGYAKVSHSGQANSYNPGTSQFSSSSSRSISPIRLQKGDLDAVANLSGQAQLQMPVINSSTSQLKQDLILKIREHEEEILQLRRHLADYSMKEAQIRNEKYVLEKRIAQMRMAFDQQQQELVDAASKALSYRQDIIEENIHLTYALQSAQQEGSTFKSSLLPLLSEYDLQPQTPDAHSIISNLKILFRHLHEKLIIAEERLKESQYQIMPWRAEASNNLNLAPQSPVHTFGAMRNGLELVPQPTYSHVHSPMTSPFNAKSRRNLDASGHQTVQASSDIFNSKKNMETASMNRISAAEETQTVLVGTQEPRVGNFNLEAKNTNLSFKDLPGTDEMEDSEEAAHPVGDPAPRWGSSGSPYVASGLDDPPGPPYLPPVLEEPSSSFSEAAEDDPLPAIHGLQISGEAYPGRELGASGYSINGTTSCNFEWVRYREDGSVSYIEGAKQPTYLVTADDVDFYLAIQVQPLDDRKRKGELIENFANDHRKIPCDPEMQAQIERILSIGNASFEVSIPAGVGNIWEQAVLLVKTEGYSIKCNGPRGVVVTEKFSPNVEIIIIPSEQPTEFLIQTSGGDQHLLMSSSSTSNRDTIVLTMRIFKKRAIEKRSRRKARFFK